MRARCALLPSRPQVVPLDGLRPAAVLVPLFEEAGETRVILTVRPTTMPTHRGEVALPGGKVDPTDESALVTALRETEEEIGLPRAAVDVVGALPVVATVVGAFSIQAYVGLLDGRPELAPDRHEVARVFDVSFSELLAEETWREERWVEPAGERPVLFFEVAGETMWGASARLLANFLAHVTAVPAPADWFGLLPGEQ